MPAARWMPLTFAIVLAGTTAAQAQYLKREPAMGALKPGQRVLVDDGRCPKGQISEVIGGDHVEVGGKAQIKRIRKCIPRQ
ncbi:MAG: DUF6719 family protein [Xanthobacteraceae bacterium]